MVAGPTASGKSALGLQLAKRWNGEIINMDSQQCYAGLVVGTGKPGPREGGVAHWLYEEVGPGEWMSAGEFARRAEQCISEMRKRGKTPVLVGGTGLYIRALLEGLDPLPARDEKIRARLEQERQEEGLAALYRRLADIDPASVQRISPQDAVRIVRSLELWELTGTAPSLLLRKGRAERLCYSTRTYCLTPDRELLREAIRHRVHEMFRGGWVEEVRGLLHRQQDPGAWPNKPIGYLEIAEALQGRRSMEEVLETIVRKTQQYAKRQETFFRGLFANPAYRQSGSSLQFLTSFGTEVPPET